MNIESINEIKARYKSSFVDKKKIIDEFLSELDRSSGSATILYQKIHSDLHKLAGSLGMYGYDDMAVNARMGMEFADNEDKQSLEGSLKKLSVMLLENS